jgi:intracellular sulfur oxidation DsrE/DsrF family protein
MKSFLYVVGFTLLSVGIVVAQASSYKVVFDLISKDSLDQKAVMRWIKEITTANPKAELEVVMYGKGYELVMPEKSSFVTEVKESLTNPNISFKVCQVAMKNNKIDKSQLLPGVQTVPDGIYEIISKQHEQWGYIKVVH